MTLMTVKKTRSFQESLEFARFNNHNNVTMKGKSQLQSNVSAWPSGKASASGAGDRGFDPHCGLFLACELAKLRGSRKQRRIIACAAKCLLRNGT